MCVCVCVCVVAADKSILKYYLKLDLKTIEVASRLWVMETDATSSLKPLRVWILTYSIKPRRGENYLTIINRKELVLSNASKEIFRFEISL